MRSLRSSSAFLVLFLLLVAGQLAAATKVVNAKIAFNSNRDGNEEIYVMNADGTGQTRLTNDAASDFLPAWSPDGSKIAFNKGFDIFVMNADGSAQTRLTSSAAISLRRGHRTAQRSPSTARATAISRSTS
jgi:tricorn protease-like protein